MSLLGKALRRRRGEYSSPYQNTDLTPGRACHFSAPAVFISRTVRGVRLAGAVRRIYLGFLDGSISLLPSPTRGRSLRGQVTCYIYITPFDYLAMPVYPIPVGYWIEGTVLISCSIGTALPYTVLLGTGTGMTTYSTLIGLVATRGLGSQSKVNHIEITS